MRITLKTLERAFTHPHEVASWNSQEVKDLRMHKIHMYPAKFPAFLIAKALKHAERRGVEVETIGDMFCGCGTTALEAKRFAKNFVGCDINPVATLIAKVKRENFDENKLFKYYDEIIFSHFSHKQIIPKHLLKNTRLLFWFELIQIEELYLLLRAIERCVPKGKYRDFFLVGFSNILKRSSKWLTKSIKPTIDKRKNVYSVVASYRFQIKQMIQAVREVNEKLLASPSSIILRKNVLTADLSHRRVDLLVTSPPYVTSYEYADLHQLSILWLGYAKDFRELRKGTIGSIYHSPITQADIGGLNTYGREVYDALQETDGRNPNTVAKYFMDMRMAVDKSLEMVNPGGLSVFVIGNTTHKGVYINNAKFLTKCMIDSGYAEIEIFQRKISSKFLTPYRDREGKFSGNKRHRKIYSYEYVVMGRNLNN